MRSTDEADKNSRNVDRSTYEEERRREQSSRNMDRSTDGSHETNDLIRSIHVLPAVDAIVAGFHRLVTDFISLNARQGPIQLSSTTSSASSSSPPPPGYVKINTDAHFDRDRPVGLGMVLRNEMGVFPCLQQSNGMAEALAIKWGLKVAHHLAYRRVVLECDALGIVHSFVSRISLLSPIGLILEYILSKVF